MSGPDLPAAHMPLSNPILALLAGVSNTYQSNIPPRTNAEWFGFGSLTDGALAATGVGCFVAVPVDQGMVVSKISILTGATAGATMTNQIAALYPGTGVTAAPLAQSTDTTNAAIGAKALVGWTLPAPGVLITLANAPNGYVYALIAITASTIPTAATAATPAGVNYPFTSTAPVFLSATVGTALAGTAPTSLTGGSVKAVAPIVVLT